MGYTLNVPRSQTIVKQSACFGWVGSCKHVSQSFTRQIRVNQQANKKDKNIGKLYLSPTVCQRLCRLLLCRSHTPTHTANFSLPRESRLDLLSIYCHELQARLFKRSSELHGQTNYEHIFEIDELEDGPDCTELNRKPYFPKIRIC